MCFLGLFLVMEDYLVLFTPISQHFHSKQNVVILIQYLKMLLMACLSLLSIIIIHFTNKNSLISLEYFNYMVLDSFRKHIHFSLIIMVQQTKMANQQNSKIFQYFLFKINLMYFYYLFTILPKIIQLEISLILILAIYQELFLN